VARRFCAVGAMGRDQLNACRGQFGVQRIAIIGLIPRSAGRGARRSRSQQECLGQGGFMRYGSRRVDGERKTSAVCHRHELRTVAPIGCSHVAAHFFAMTNVPSMKHGLRSSAPCAFRSSALCRVHRRKAVALELGGEGESITHRSVLLAVPCTEA
jgi:hypothetical protein